ncbi:MAG: hypothetical protein GY774_39860 [Planctomycetes bacterium]|nr:hypothetical protein [Planctomycetota bacterium]
MKIMKRHLLVHIMLLVSLLIPTISGCDDKNADSNHELDFLKGLVNNPKVDINLKQRAQLTILKLENGVMDSEPFLIAAMITTVGVEDGEIISLSLIIYDEDADYIGFEVEEEHVDSNNVVVTRLIERYPVFTYLPYSSELLFRFTPILVRDENQRKPEEQWLKYINTPLHEQKEDYKKRTNKNWTWLKTLPPVWLSIPDPGKLNIYVRVYDRAGHLSERVPLVDKRKKWPSEE